MNRLYYLKPNVVIEPLVDRWYAWSHLISPATAAMNIAGRHMKIINSYIQAPHIHAAAAKNPKMLGGPFMDFEEPKVQEIKELRDFTVTHRKLNLEFAQAVKDLDNMLKGLAKGYSLDCLYENVPPILQGYVELVYDLNNNVSFRLFEPLLYQSPLYNKASQSIALWLTENDERPFVLSTPKLNSSTVIHVNIPFESKIIDSLATMKRSASTMEEIETLFPVNVDQLDLFKSLFTEIPPKEYKAYTGNKIRMRYFGHACILIETKDISILVDPLISYYGYNSDVSHFSDIDLPNQIDYVLVTHNHQDHVLLETLLPLRHKIKKIIVPRGGSGALQDPSLKLMLRQIGFQDVTEITELETLKFSDCTITGIPFMGEHSDLNIQSKICHLVKFNHHSVLFVADSCNIEPRVYQLVQKFTGNVDVIFLGMECEGAPLSWLYGPLLTNDLPRDKDNSRRLSGSNFTRGKSLVETFNAKEVYVYAMGLEPWLKFISSIKYNEDSLPIVESNKLCSELSEKGMIAERLFGEKELLYDY